MAELRHTPLDAVHRKSGARLGPFGGWEMPVEYARPHLRAHGGSAGGGAVRRLPHGGVRDRGPRGPGLPPAGDRERRRQARRRPGPVLGPAERARLPPGRRDPVSARGRSLPDDRQRRQRREGPGPGCRGRSPPTATSATSATTYALLALQGPRAEAVLQKLTGIDLSEIRFYRFADGDVDGRPTLVARTGYTGEAGFELLVAPDGAAALWTALLEAGSGGGPGSGRPRGPRHAAPRGSHAALRQRHGRDHDPGGSGPGLDRLPRRGQGRFQRARGARGAEGLGRPDASSSASRSWGGASPATGTRSTWPTGPTGAVTSGSYAPFLKKNIGLCYLPAAHAAVDTEFDVEIRGRPVPARVVPTPFYKRPR